MASSKKLQVSEDVQPNLIPMIDIMFLLLLFFMLGADMGQREMEEVILPKAQFVKEEKEAEKGEAVDRLIVNVHHLHASDGVECDAIKAEQVCREKKHWRIGIQGRDFSDPKKLEAHLMFYGNRGRTQKMDKLSSGTQAPTSESTVMIRADRSAPYGQVQEVVNACAKVGIYKIECGAAANADLDDTKKG